MTVTGVVASVAITIRGNSSTTDNIVSLGVGKALANSCNNSTAVKTDTISQWDDTYGDFMLQRVDVSGVQSSCQNNAMTLVINMSTGNDLNVTCNLPATGAQVYSQGTFVFASTSFADSGAYYGCPNFTPRFSWPQFQRR
jgi:alpha-L-arabinofuranosidase